MRLFFNFLLLAFTFAPSINANPILERFLFGPLRQEAVRLKRELANRLSQPDRANEWVEKYEEIKNRLAMLRSGKEEVKTKLAKVRSNLDECLNEAGEDFDKKIIDRLTGKLKDFSESLTEFTAEIRRLENEPYMRTPDVQHVESIIALKKTYKQILRDWKRAFNSLANHPLNAEQTRDALVRLQEELKIVEETEAKASVYRELIYTLANGNLRNEPKAESDTFTSESVRKMLWAKFGSALAGILLTTSYAVGGGYLFDNPFNEPTWILNTIARILTGAVALSLVGVAAEHAPFLDNVQSTLRELRGPEELPIKNLADVELALSRANSAPQTARAAFKEFRNYCALALGGTGSGT